MSQRTGRGFTLIELLVVMAVIAVLIAILLPAVQAAREAARRSACNNNCKQIGLALHNYHDAHRSFPVGAAAVYNSNWLVALLPYVEFANTYDQLQSVDFNYASGAGGGVNGPHLAGLVIPTYICPTSDLPTLTEFGSTSETGADKWGRASYIGVTGASSAVTAAVDPAGKNRCADDGRYGFSCNNGVLPLNAAASIGDISDGTTNTIAAAEDSNWLFDAASGTLVDDNLTRQYGFAMGVEGAGNPPMRNYCGVTTTLRYAVGDNTWGVNAASDGRGRCGANHTFTSMHRGGAFAIRADGGTRFLSDGTGLSVLQNLGCRDDKVTLRNNPLTQD